MSYVFDINDVTVWSPALKAGDAYVRCARALGDTLNLDPGFDSISEDMIQIDLDKFASFANSLLLAAEASQGQIVLVDLIGAVLSPSLVMLERAGLTLDPGRAMDWVARVEKLRGMPQ